VLRSVKGLWIGECAEQRRLVAGEQADLEVRPPLMAGRHDPVLGTEPESEPAVVGGVSEQPREGLAERVGRAEDGMHEGAANALALAVWPDCQRPEREHRCLAHVSAGAQHVPDDLVGQRNRHQREFGQPCRASPKIVNQPGLRRVLSGEVCAGKRGGRDGVNGACISRCLASYQHRFTMDDRRLAAQPITAAPTSPASSP
jgi:hypothetical protein